MKKGLISAKAFQRWQAGHPWLRADDILARKDLPQRPAAIYFGDNWWLCSPKSYLRLRRLGPPQLGWMKNPRVTSITNSDQFRAYFGEWMLAHLTATLKRKLAALTHHHDRTDDSILRWIFSESDLLPGLTVDLFEYTLVCQITTAPIEAFWFSIRELLIAAYAAHFSGKAPLQIIELRNSPARQKEGLEVIAPPAGDDGAANRILNWNGYKWHFALHSLKQKTGAYLDQRDNHRRAAEVAKSFALKTAWDICSYQGGFTLHLLGAGLQVTAVDQSVEALEFLAKNVSANSLDTNRLNVANDDAFDWLHCQREAGRTADMIVLDPPSFAKSREALSAARKGYLELNRLALECLNPGGVLVSCVCSHHMRPGDYKLLLEKAAKGAKRSIKIIEMRGPSPDHAPLPGFIEGDYLQAWFLQSVVD